MSEQQLTTKEDFPYEWDAERQGWFPKIDENDMAMYQMAYGVTEDTPTPSTSSVEPQPQDPPLTFEEFENRGVKRKANNEANWFEIDDQHNTNVYVSGLPLDITEDEFITFMSKAGMIMKEPETNKFKVKLYADSNGVLKGDARCCYIKIESVQLALDILDGSRIKDNTISVEVAKFQLKGSYDPTKKPRKKRGKDKEKIKKRMEKLFDWRPEKMRGERGWHEKTVIIKNMFDPSEFEGDASLLLDYNQDLQDECSKFGEVKKVVVYDRNPEGVAAISFKSPEEADSCIKVMDKRWFASRQLKAELWDGITKYKVEETEEERQKRLNKWDEFLEKEDPKYPENPSNS